MSGLPGPLGAVDDLVREASVTFLLHGFNVNRQEGRDSLYRLAGRLAPVIGGAIVIVLWPGDHWAGPISYPFEGNDADASAAELVRFIERVVEPSTTLSFVSHSLGARVVMETLKRLGDGYAIRQVCLMAPAIDDSSLADPEVYASSAESAQRVAVLASRKDSVLQLAYPIGDLLSGVFLFLEGQRRIGARVRGTKAGGEPFYSRRCLSRANSRWAKFRSRGLHPAETPSPNQLSASEFAQEVLQGTAVPRYP
jgi:pimeloyl-ACP methyl ester carboxylesterase